MNIIQYVLYEISIFRHTFTSIFVKDEQINKYKITCLTIVDFLPGCKTKTVTQA